MTSARSFNSPPSMVPTANTRMFKISDTRTILHEQSGELVDTVFNKQSQSVTDFAGLCREFPDRKIFLIKVLRELTGLNLSAAKAAVTDALRYDESYQNQQIPPIAGCEDSIKDEDGRLLWDDRDQSEYPAGDFVDWSEEEDK